LQFPFSYGVSVVTSSVRFVFFASQGSLISMKAGGQSRSNKFAKQQGFGGSFG
jgi:hypothetical protein